MLLWELLGLLDGVLVEIVNDYFFVLKKLDLEEVDSVDVSVFVFIGVLLMWFDCFKDDICIVIKFMLKEFVFLVLKLFFVDGF